MLVLYTRSFLYNNVTHTYSPLPYIEYTCLSFANNSRHHRPNEYVCLLYQIHFSTVKLHPTILYCIFYSAHVHAPAQKYLNEVHHHHVSKYTCHRPTILILEFKLSVTP